MITHIRKRVLFCVWFMMVLAIIAVGLIASLQALKTNLATTFDNVGNAVKGAN